MSTPLMTDVFHYYHFITVCSERSWTGLAFPYVLFVHRNNLLFVFGLVYSQLLNHLLQVSALGRYIINPLSHFTDKWIVKII